jgi:hypothetical protein
VKRLHLDAMEELVGILSGAADIVGTLVTYPMLASRFGWWMPEGISEWGLIAAGAAGLVSSLPTVIWGWLEPGTHDRPYPADEDLD